MRSCLSAARGWALVVAFLLAARSAAQAQELPPCPPPAVLPADVVITPPDGTLDPKIAAFSGVWAGNWDDTNPAGMAVTRAAADNATITYGFAGDSRIVVRPATISPDGVMRWRFGDSPNAGSYTFALSEDATTLAGT